MLSLKRKRYLHDTWSAYDYNGKIKVVYFKNRVETQNIELLFSELYDIPLRYREMVMHSVFNGGFTFGKTEQKKKENKKENSFENERLKNSVSRSRSRIFELAICNEFQFFCTFTQNEKYRDRFDLKQFRKEFSQYVRNLNRHRPDSEKIKYLLIPEKHKNGAWHMHGLLMGLTKKDLRPFTLKERLPMSIKNKLLNGEIVYNWEKYSQKFGFFTCTEIKSREACSKYITKYVTKDMAKNNLENGAHLYFASQGLNGKKCIVKNFGDVCPVNKWDFENEYIKIAWVDTNSLSKKQDSEL